MSEENKASRVNIEDLPQGERELTAEESNEVQGGEGHTGPIVGHTRLIVGDDQGVFGAGVDSVKP
jgi:hypothetical protein